jgi:hypothetical protein
VSVIIIAYLIMSIGHRSWRRRICRSWSNIMTLQARARFTLMLIIEDLTVTVKCRTAITPLFLYFNLCLNVILDSLSCSFTSISFLTTFIVFVWGVEVESWSKLCVQNNGVLEFNPSRRCL